MTLPYADDAVVEVDLDYLFIDRPNDDGRLEVDKKRGDPRTMAPLRIQSKRLFFDNRELGRLDLATRRRVDGMQIEHLTLISPSTHITAQGTWLVTADAQQQTSLGATITSEDMGATLTMFGYADTIHKGKAG
ncbi:MAG: hypothetical protein FD130_2592 [Halothiobacillaceae bacterium]|nr:MAG: hypothetical protein FD130_2592 [Halothiobacillaceae bacterium]